MFKSHERIVLIRSFGIFLIAAGLLIHLSLIEKYLNYENDRRIKAIENKLDIVFEHNLDITDPASVKILEDYKKLDTDTSLQVTVNNVAKSVGFLYAIFGIFAILLGEHYRNYKK